MLRQEARWVLRLSQLTASAAVLGWMPALSAPWMIVLYNDGWITKQAQRQHLMQTRRSTECRRNRTSALINRRLLIGLLFAVVVLLAAFYAYQHQRVGQSPQALSNLAAAENPSLCAAIMEYPKWWPPGYPIALWAFAHAGLPVRYFNLLCFVALLVLVWLFFRRNIPNVHPAFPVALITSTYSAYENSYVQTSESLFVLIAFLCALALAYYLDVPTLTKALLLGAMASATVLTRFFGLFWVVPLIALYLWFSVPDRSLRERACHIAVYIGVFLHTVVPWLLWVKALTGSFSGMNRFADRSFPKSMSHWGQLTDFGTNVKLMIKTIFIDFFSPSRSASHHVVNETLLRPEEYVAPSAILVLTAGAIIFAAYTRFRRTSSTGLGIKSLLSSARMLPVSFAITYILSLVGVWSFTNNDPIYTRFMYPSYVFLVLAFFSAYSWLKDWQVGLRYLVPFYLLYFLCAATNLSKIVLSAQSH